MDRLTEIEREQWRAVRPDTPDGRREMRPLQVLTSAEYLEFLRFAERFAPAHQERAFITGGEHWKL